VILSILAQGSVGKTREEIQSVLEQPNSLDDGMPQLTLKHFYKNTHFYFIQQLGVLIAQRSWISLATAH
jgi:hypothetical protein